MNKTAKYALIASLPIAIAIIFVFSYKEGMYDMQQESGLFIAADIAELRSVFKRIHKTCKILSFDYQKNPINFLNVRTFAGSEVGSINLVYPKKWEGPYLQDNPTMQGKEYMVVHTNDGYFITPGEGVRLPSGKIIGKDVLLGEDADIPAMMGDKDIFLYEEPLEEPRLLAARIEI